MQFFFVGKMISFMVYCWTIKYCNFISKRDLKRIQIPKFRIFERYVELLFFIQLWCIYFPWNWFCREIPMSTDFLVSEMNSTERGQQKPNSKFDISYSISNFNAFFWQNYHLYGLLMNRNRCNFHNSTISHIWKKYLTLEMLSKIQWVWGFFLCTTHWCVKQFTVKSKILCPHLFLIYTCSTFPYRYADVASCFALFSFLLFLSRVLSNEWK